MNASPLSIWADRLAAAATPTLSLMDLSDLRANPNDFRDELGQQRPVDPLLVAAAIGGGRSNPPAPPVDAPADVQLWAALVEGAPVPDGTLAPGDGGPLLRHRPRTTIEVFTEAELCALHALDALARRSGHARLADRCLKAAAWHINELQPDNATNLPWAIHVFVRLAGETGHPAADIEAQTRLHNASAGRGRPDRRAAIILYHAERELRLRAGD